VSTAIALATVSTTVPGRIYNVADRENLSEADWVRRIGRSANWDGSVISLPAAAVPSHLRVPYRHEQHWEMSSARIGEELGYAEPVDFAAAIDKTIAWERANPPREIEPSQLDYAAEDAAIAAIANLMRQG
jgi:nucleoside-diphosphate-sugar epimerase